MKKFMVTYTRLIVGEHFRETKRFSQVLTSDQIEELLSKYPTTVIGLMKEL